MTGDIQVLNVGDGDAILVHLVKPGAELVVVIDGGEPGCYGRVVQPALKNLLQRTGKAAPDLVIVTHYDSDHIGGLIPLMADYADGIREVWVHRAPNLTTRAKLLVEAKNQKNYIKSFEENKFDKSLLAKYPAISSEELLPRASLVLESLNQLEELLSLVPLSKVREVFHNDTYPQWPEIRVLGPTTEYYRSLFPSGKSLEELVQEELTPSLTANQQAAKARFTSLASYNQNPCDLLKTEAQTQLTPTNKASIIIAIDSAKGRFLFTGDAGISSFKAIPNWQTELEKVYWLKIPHHGSDNNISSELISVLQPLYADNSGDRYEDPHVLGCLSLSNRSITVRSTKASGALSTDI